VSAKKVLIILATLTSSKSFSLSTKATELPIPPRYEGRLSADGERVFELNVRDGKVNFFDGVATSTRGINGNILGPTLYAKRGDTVKLRVTNQLDEATTMHWHGMHLPAKMDGGPYQVIKPGAEWVSTYPIKQLAATLWYHPHLMGKTGLHVYQGLAGMFILEDEVSANADIPKEYGYDDIPVIIQDRRFTADGQLQYIESPRDIMRGMLGNRILVNGALEPRWQAPAKLVRLRILNGSNARVYNLGFSDKRIFHQIATDGGLVERPVPLRQFRLAPGERTELLVDLSKDLGKSLSLAGFYRNREGKSESFPVLAMTVAEAFAGPKETIPNKLAKITWFDPDTATTKRHFALTMGQGGFRINNLTMDMSRIDEQVTLGSQEIWSISTNMMIHPFHIHDIQFQIISRGGNPPEPWERGWKDTVLIYPGEETRVTMQFLDYADPDIPYMYHCHILEHEDAGMMGQFVVVKKEEQP